MRNILLALTAFVAVSAAPLAGDLIPGPVRASLVSCYDGDTCRFVVEVWPDITIHTAVRFRGIDAPEIRGECATERVLAIQARDVLIDRLKAAKTIELSDIEADKYGGRVLAHVLIDSNAVAADLISAGLGRPYDGGTRAGWCSKPARL